jgi:nicotinamidase-related amidase
VTTALLLIDIQNDYFAGGRMALRGPDAAARQAAALVARFRAAGDPIVHVRHVADQPDATFFLPDTEGALIHSSVEPAPGEIVIEKHQPNAFLATPLGEHLETVGATSLVIAGMMTHMCVDSTTRAASERGFDCVVVADACATRDLNYNGVQVGADLVHAAFLAALDGTFAAVESTSHVLER